MSFKKFGMFLYKVNNTVNPSRNFHLQPAIDINAVEINKYLLFFVWSDYEIYSVASQVVFRIAKLALKQLLSFAERTAYDVWKEKNTKTHQSFAVSFQFRGNKVQNN